MKKFHLALSLCAVLCLSAQADEKSSATDASKSKDSNTQSLGVIEVTSDSSTPSTVDDVKINTRNATLVKDVFRDILGVYVGGTNGMNQKIYMRGVSDRGLNITIDGAK